MFFIPFFVLLIILIAIVMLKAVKIVPESQVYIVEKLGKYYQSLSSGLSFINPFFDRVSRVVSLKEQVVEFANLASYSSVENDNIQMKNILQRIIGFNTILPISHNLSQIQFIPSSDIVITIYFYPICYKVDAINYSFYTLKGAHQFDGLYCDGIYEVRTVENQLNMKES